MEEVGGAVGVGASGEKLLTADWIFLMVIGNIQVSSFLLQSMLVVFLIFFHFIQMQMVFSSEVLSY